MSDASRESEGAALGGDIAWDVDTRVEVLRQRMADIDVSYGHVEELANMGEGSLRKYLSDTHVRQLTVNSLLALTSALGLRVELHVEPKLVRRMQPYWLKRDGSKAHGRRPPSVSAVTVKRFLPTIAAEMGRRGGEAWVAKTTPEQRRELGRRGAAVPMATPNIGAAARDFVTMSRSRS